MRRFTLAVTFAFVNLLTFLVVFLATADTLKMISEAQNSVEEDESKASGAWPQALTCRRAATVRRRLEPDHPREARPNLQHVARSPGVAGSPARGCCRAAGALVAEAR